MSLTNPLGDLLLGDRLLPHQGRKPGRGEALTNVRCVLQTGGEGLDIINGGAGTDTADYSTSTDGVTVNLGIVGAQLVSPNSGSDTLIDGVTATFPTVTGGQGISVFPSVDAIQEFKVLGATFPAEFGRSLGSVINVAYKSGSNTFHAAQRQK